MFFNRRRAHAALMILAFALAAAFILTSVGCKKSEKIVVPEGLTREEAALYVAAANVCPKNDNHSKVDYLTFFVEGWSFDELPKAVYDYLAEYCTSGGARMMQFSTDALEEMGLIKSGDGDFYGEDEKVYAEGKGKIFTFKLGEGQDVNADTLLVSVTGSISDRDTSGFDVKLNYENGAWQYAGIVNAWNYYQFVTPDPNETNVPLR